MSVGSEANVCGCLLLLGAVVTARVHGYRVVQRNFYGQLRVGQRGEPSDPDFYRWLAHGVINHGEQMLHPDRRRDPIAYFCPQSGIGRALTARLPARSRIGILGLGCGTLAAYGRPGDTYRIYEINPLVAQFANTEFTFLQDTRAKVEIVLGDGRLSLERELSQQFDVLIMDAFSGDSAPVHLITREAFQIYLRHLKAGGILAINITNLYLDLRSVVERAASHFGKLAILCSDSPIDSFVCYASDWVLVADPSIRDSAPELTKAGMILPPNSNFRMWTDDFSNVWRILR